MRRTGQRGTRRGAEIALLVAGCLVLVLALMLEEVPDDIEWVLAVLGPLGLALIGLSGLAWTVRSLGAGPFASFPTTVGRTRLALDRGLRWRMAVTLALTLGIPIAVAVAVVGLVEEGWLLVTFVLVMGSGGLAVGRSVAHRNGGAAEGLAPLLDRLCMLADMPVPELVTERSRVPIAWTSAGRIHLSEPLVRSLERDELEAVLAHELAHLAHRDAAVMDLTTAPSRLLLGIVTICFAPGRLDVDVGLLERLCVLGMGLVVGPPALVFGWSLRLLALNLSRAREYVADAAAATLTGQPSALASALLKLEAAQPGIARRDLREMEARSPLCIVAIRASRVGRLVRTHPPTAERVARLERMEERLHATPASL